MVNKIFSTERRKEICSQIYIYKIFDEYHNKTLFSRDKLVTNYKQALAMALSISNKKCLNFKNLKKDYLINIKIDDILKLIKSNELKSLIKQSEKKDIKKWKGTKRDLYNQYFNNKNKFINFLIFHIKNNI